MYILVEAVLPEGKVGFIGDRGELPHIRRYNGDRFEVDEKAFSEKWMKRVKGKPGPKKKEGEE